MGCDIHCYAERKAGEEWEMIRDLSPFDWRDYRIFAFLANVRNEAGILPIAQARDLPDDPSDGVVVKAWHWRDIAHSHSWLDVSELLDFNYERVITVEERLALRDPWDRMFADRNNPDGLETTTIRALLGEAFFDDLHELKRRGAERIVFWFDN
jgi:hypothetical protein